MQSNARNVTTLLLFIALGITSFFIFIRPAMDRSLDPAVVIDSYRQVVEVEQQSFSGQRQLLHEESIVPVDEFFELEVIPNTGEFIASFTGPKDTFVTLWKMIKDKNPLSDEQDNMRNHVQANLDEYLQIPSGLFETLDASQQRYVIQLEQDDSRFRQTVYDFVQGQGVVLDEERLAASLDQMHSDVMQVFQATTLPASVEIAGDRTVDGMLVFSASEIISTALVTLFVRMGWLSFFVTTSATTGSAAAATSTTPVGPPLWVVAGSAVIAGFLVDWVIGLIWDPDAKAESSIKEQMQSLREEIRNQLSYKFTQIEERMWAERMSLMENMLGPVPSLSKEGTAP